LFIGHRTHLSKSLLTLVYASILSATLGLSTSEASATCQSAGACNSSTNVNSTLSFDHYSNSTVANSPALSFNQFSNSTLSFNQFSNSTLSFNQFSNSTSVAENDTNQTLVPKTLFHFLFEEENNTNTENTTSDLLQLQGNQYITENSSSTNLKSFTISAWAKPDYSQGSPIFTIISDERAFALAINNNIPPLKVATFSVFDGIRWITVQSTSTIPEQWTHLAATFNGTSIGLYVNGKLEGTSPIPGIPTLVSGDLTTKTMQNLTSNGNITIGASYEKVRLQSRNLFSGEISNVNLYGLVLTHDQINQIYNSTKPEDSVIYSH
jgi:hypothetical protein